MGKRFSNPPIQEALCEIFFDEYSWDDTIPGRIYAEIKDEFKIKKQLRSVQVEVSIAPGGESGTKVRNLVPRVQFVREQGDRIVQVAPGLLVVNQLTPYGSFEDWRPTLLKMIELYRSLTRAAKVKKIGFRYLDRIVLKGSAIEMKNFFRIFPQIPETLTTVHGPFVLRVSIPSRHSGHETLVTFGTTPQGATNAISFMLDLYNKFIPGAENNDVSIEREVDIAQRELETVFLNCITPRLAKQFGG